MTKSDLIAQLAEQNDLPLRKADSIVNTILETMTETLAQGKNIEFRGFGGFTIRKYEAYEGRAPKTGEKVMVKPKKLPFFKMGKELRERVNGGR